MARLYVVECLAIGQVKGVLTIFAFVGEGFGVAGYNFLYLSVGDI